MTNDNFALEEPKEAYIEEIYPQVDPNQIEKELIEQYKESQKNMPAEDVAAHFFRMFFPRYQSVLQGLSNKEARRVAEHVVQWPLEEEFPTFSSPEGKAAFQLGTRLLDCKMIMKGVFEMERLREAQEQQAKVALEKQEAIVGTVAIEQTEEGIEANGK